MPLLLILISLAAKAQSLPVSGSSNPASGLFEQNADSTGVDSMSTKWKDEQAKIEFKTLYSEQRRFPDTTISEIHRFQPRQPWWGKTLGNYGTATRNLFFTPDAAPGLQLGYHAYDLYKFSLDSLRFYNTTRPYSVFSFMLGSKNQQNVEILHTQNITPLWNFAARLRYLSSDGFYALQKANSIAGSFNTDYSSKNERYKVKAALVYNKFKQGENGGITRADSFLALSNFNDRSRIPVNFSSPYNTNNKSPVQNSLRDFDFFIQNNYSWGVSDTLYNEDSTKATYRFTPRFRLQHELLVHSEKHQYKDEQPDSLRYVPLAAIAPDLRDSVYGVQAWTYYDNKFSLNGFLGSEEHLAQIQVGIANRIDHFGENYVTDKDKQTYFGNYVFGLIQKEALAPRQWAYEAGASFYFTGNALGNFELNLAAGKDLGKWGQFSAGARQSLTNAPFAWQHFKTNYYSRDFDLNKTSITEIWGKINIEKIKLEIFIDNYLINNYLYYDDQLIPQASGHAFSLLQIYARKKLSHGIFSLNNELVWQQATANAPLHLPAFMFREQLALEGMLFKNALHVALGLEARYETNYYADGYTPFLNQFFYQNDYKTNNIPELSAFFNFKVRNFRAYVIGGQLQQFFAKANMNAPGYPEENSLFRFGFIWVLIN